MKFLFADRRDLAAGEVSGYRQPSRISLISAAWLVGPSRRAGTAPVAVEQKRGGERAAVLSSSQGLSKIVVGTCSVPDVEPYGRADRHLLAHVDLAGVFLVHAGDGPDEDAALCPTCFRVDAEPPRRRRAGARYRESRSSSCVGQICAPYICSTPGPGHSTRE